MSRIMIIDDEVPILQSLKRLLRCVPCQYGKQQFALELECYCVPQAAIDAAHQRSFELIISDYRMPLMDGVSLLKTIKSIQPDAAYFILSGYADLNGVLRAINELGIERFVCKPWNDYEFVAAIAQSLSVQALRIENQQLADLVRLECGDITPQEAEAKRLERIEPGITQVRWGLDGSVILDTEPENIDEAHQ